ncbi:MAG: transposase [Anaerolineaceae bacterium]|nr:transposase [Anaerolineaceae bacterium]
MHKIVNPQQKRLFDPFDSVLTGKTRKRLLDGWSGVFRHVILELMPVDTIAGRFHSAMGRPTKELYSMAGLVLIMEFKNWTKEEALDAYRFHLDIQYALNLEPVAHDISMRTLERYINYFEEDNLAKTIMSDITVELVDLLGIKIDQQRLDSTHIFSDMASFGRTRLMGVAVKRFLTQVIRSNQQNYNSLDESLRQRYAPGVNQLFADTKKDSESRRLLRQQVAEDMYYLIQRFADMDECNRKDTYKAVERIFYEQCEVHEETVSIKQKTGGDVMQNPSDPDATYDGHKGPGYQAQIAETCNPQNKVQIITCAIPQTAAEPDANAVEEVLDDLQANDLLPDSMLVDTSYTGDDNVQLAEEKGVELVGPVPSGSSKAKADEYEQLNIDDFDVDDATEEVICCPAGHKPQSSEHNNETDKTKTVMPESACSQCEFFEQCPIEKIKGQYAFEHTSKQRRLAGRRREQDTEVFRERYKTRGGIEGTNSGLKRRVGLGQLRVRGRPAVFHAIYLKVAGWNILRASVCAKMREIVYARANMATFGLYFAFLRMTIAVEAVRMDLKRRFLLHCRKFERFSTLSIAA